jgi:hypothetical protein
MILCMYIYTRGELSHMVQYMVYIVNCQSFEKLRDGSLDIICAETQASRHDLLCRICLCIAGIYQRHRA